jgi:cold shock CspA family protein
LIEIDKIVGRVYRFDPSRGYGFIQREGFPHRDPAGSVFFHVSRVPGGIVGR